MKVLIFILLSLTALTKAERDLSKYKPSHIHVKPKIILPFQPRIVGGKEALRRQFPHQVALFINGRSFCGGSLIKENVILTAAHCMDGASSVEVVAGVNNIQKNEASVQTKMAGLSNIKIHDNWDPNTLKNDIALILLSGGFSLNDYVQTVALYRGNSALNGVQATVSGWGRISDQAQTVTDKLRYVTSNIMSKAGCSEYFGIIITDNHVCLEGQGGKGACNGDSGGPLHIAENNKLYQAGIVSFGSATGCEKGYPSVFCRISSFIDWIDKNMS